ncbi:MAG: HXXEE domain-containing protein [Pseudomonadota bacterium]
MNLKASGLWLALFFAALWLPLGQHDFLVLHWMKVGTFLAPVLLFMLFSADQRLVRGVNIRAMSVIMLVLYLVHQFEEHWIDLFGNYYAFYYSFNGLIADALGVDKLDFEILSPYGIFFINTSLVWLVGFIAIQFGEKVTFTVLAMNAIILINGLTHIVAGVAKQTYNPGLLTSILLFLPFSIWFYRQLLANHLASRLEIAYSIIWAIVAHVVMIAGLIGVNWFNVVPAIYYDLTLMAWSLLPIFASLLLDRKDGQ